MRFVTGTGSEAALRRLRRATTGRRTVSHADSLSRPGSHCGVEHGTVLGMRLGPLKEALTVQTPESPRSGPDGFVEVTQRPPDEVDTEHQRPRADGLRVICTQCLAQVCVTKAPIGVVLCKTPSIVSVRRTRFSDGACTRTAAVFRQHAPARSEWGSSPALSIKARGAGRPRTRCPMGSG
jgi:hypothetical protein